ncbi:putative vacuolar protein sorting-associated Vps28 [Helianthus anomalus]
MSGLDWVVGKDGAVEELTEQQARQLHFDLQSSYYSFTASLPTTGDESSEIELQVLFILITWSIIRVVESGVFLILRAITPYMFTLQKFI